MASVQKRETAQLALRVARLYYVQAMTTAAIAAEMGTSRATVSRLLSYAMDKGLVEIRINDPDESSGSLSQQLVSRYKLHSVQVVPATSSLSEQELLGRVAVHAAAYLNSLMTPSMVLGLAWGTTVASIADALSPKVVRDVDVVQLNGSGTGQAMVNSFGETLVSRFAQNYGGRAHGFPVPAFFDFADTRTALWRERSIKAIRTLQERAAINLFSIGVKATGSHVHTSGYLSKQEERGIEREGVVGDIATVFFRKDGSWRDIPLNARSSGPDLDRFSRARHSICVVSGQGKLAALRAALCGRFINELVIDEPSARLLAAPEAADQDSPTTSRKSAA